MNIVHPSQKRLMTYEELVDNYGQNINRLEYYAIIAAIPRQWKHLIKNTDWTTELDIEDVMEKLSKLKAQAKHIYWKMLEDCYPKS